MSDNIERAVSTCEIADFMREEWLYDQIGDPIDDAVREVLSRLAKRFDLEVPK